jgi:protease I
MAKDTLKGLNVAILVTDGFEQVELTEPREALDEAGGTTKTYRPNVIAYGRGISRTGA